MRNTDITGSDQDELALSNEFYGKDKKEDVEAPADVPMSPGKKLLYYAGSPGRYIKAQIRPGSVKSSIFSLVIICLGAGTLTIPYTFYALGFALGTFMLLLGGLMSVFAGWMLAYACQKTNATCFEECAMVCFGKKAQIATSISMIACNGGFLLSYIVLVSFTFSHCFSSNHFYPTQYNWHSAMICPPGATTHSTAK